ncbi:MAG: hypothetical protein MW689_000231 [Thermodesulfobacteria bacterium]|nr:pilus assembly protein PilP [Thermodesulfobacteriota bacterium]MCU4138442.1 hypothetical protein [Thermodesulfobacteriota bacterium]
MRYITIILIILIIAGCFHKEEEKTKIAKNFTKEEKIEDTELKNWIKALEEKSFKINISKLKNPFIDPEVLKLIIAKREKIPLELVGILKKEKERIALLQDNTKKGYIVKTGSKIGNIKVLEIGTDYVIIEEEEINIYGEKEKRRKILPLKKD